MTTLPLWNRSVQTTKSLNNSIVPSQDLDLICDAHWLILRAAVFLDHDGVININHFYVHMREDFDFIDGAFDIARHAYVLNYKLLVITN